jgi:hypothetical protein
MRQSPTDGFFKKPYYVATPARSGKKEHARTRNEYAIEAHRKHQQTQTKQWPRVQILPPRHSMKLDRNADNPQRTTTNIKPPGKAQEGYSGTSANSVLRIPFREYYESSATTSATTRTNKNNQRPTPTNKREEI